MSRRAAASLTVCALAIALSAVAAPAHAALHSRYFKMPSRNIECAMYSAVLRCDIRSGLNPEPKRKCELDWTGLYLGNKAGPECAGDTVHKNGSPVLDYGSKWKRQGIVCRSRTSGLRCHNRKGHGFFLSRESWDTY